MRLAPYEWEFWLEHGGKTEPWLPSRPGYRPQEALVTDLKIGEMQRVAQLTANLDSNVLYVRRNSDHEYVGVVDAPRSDDDPRRGQFEWHQAESLHGLYLRIGEALEMLPYWCDSELETFVPYDRPRIPVL